MPKIKKSLGFTLVELLVALGIVALVAGIIISSAAAIQRTSRDTQRQADLRTIQQAVQQFYADHQYYPADSEINTMFGQSLVGRGSNNNKLYLSKIPQDPLPAPAKYCYASMKAANIAVGGAGFASLCDTSMTDCHYYRICANLENVPATPANCSCGSPSLNYNYQITPP